MSLATVSPVIILDWDDTVVLTSSKRRALLVETIRELSPGLDEAAASLRWGAPFHQLVRSIAPELDFQLLMPRYFEAMTKNPPVLAEGAASFLKFLRRHGSRIVVFTSSIRSLVELDAEILSISDLIDAIWSSDEGSFFKPDPRSLSDFLACYEAQTPLSSLCYIGDSLSDLRVANGVGINFLAVTTGSTSRDEFRNNHVLDDKIFESLGKIEELWKRDSPKHDQRGFV